MGVRQFGRAASPSTAVAIPAKRRSPATPGSVLLGRLLRRQRGEGQAAPDVRYLLRVFFTFLFLTYRALMHVAGAFGKFLHGEWSAACPSYQPPLNTDQIAPCFKADTGSIVLSQRLECPTSRAACQRNKMAHGRS